MASSSVLYAVGKEIGASCQLQNRAFLKCKAEDADPEACLDKGDAVQECALCVLKSAMATCETTFQKYASCLDKQISEEYMFERCRREEKKFNECRSGAKQSSTTAASSTSEKAEKVRNSGS